MSNPMEAPAPPSPTRPLAYLLPLEVAAILSCSESNVYRLIKRGSIGSRCFVDGLKVNPDDVQRILIERRRGPLNCANCEAEFRPLFKKGVQIRKYCSIACARRGQQARKYQRLRKLRVVMCCEHCGSQFITGRTDHRYCSRKCKCKSKYLRNRGKRP